STRNLRARTSIYRYLEPPFDLHDWVIDLVDWRGGQTILDVGCGYGPVLQRLAQHTPSPVQIVGLDRSPAMLAAIEQGVRCATVLGDMGVLPFAGSSFDIVFAVHCLYYADDVAGTARELVRVLRPGGRLVA